MAVFALAGRLFRADLVHGDVVEVTTVGPVIDPRPDPTGRAAGLRHRRRRGGAPGPAAGGRADGTDTLLAGEDSGVTWGLAEHIAAEEFGRFRGYWWAPDGRSVLAARVDESRLPRWHLHDPADPASPPTTVAYPRAGGPNAEVSLHLLDLDGGWVDVHWDRETYPYLTSVDWADGGPLITVLRRSQQHGLVLAVDPRTGETQVHAELADPRWVEPIPGTPAHLPDGRVLVGGELAHDGYDARCLFADGTLLTPPSLYVRRVVGRLPAGRTDRPTCWSRRARASRASGTCSGSGRRSAAAVDARRMTGDPGWHTAAVGGDDAGGRHRLAGPRRGPAGRCGAATGRWPQLRSLAATPPYAPRPMLERVTDRRLPAAVLYPDEPRRRAAGCRCCWTSTAARGTRRWSPPGRPGWNGSGGPTPGFAVVTIDNRGTPGVAPSFEKAIHRRVADVILADQIDALTALAGKHPDLDLGRVAVRGWSFGGWLAGLAVLRHPELFRCAIVGAPVTDWALYDTAYTERYLGLPDDGMDVYAHHSLVELAAEPVGDPDAGPAAAAGARAGRRQRGGRAHAATVGGAAGDRPAARGAAADRGDPHGRRRHRRAPAPPGAGLPPPPPVRPATPERGPRADVVTTGAPRAGTRPEPRYCLTYALTKAG